VWANLYHPFPLLIEFSGVFRSSLLVTSYIFFSMCIGTEWVPPRSILEA